MDNYRNNVYASARDSGAVTPSDTTALKFDAIYVGGTGAVVIKHTDGGPDVTYSGIPAGTILPVSGTRIMASSTATNMVWMRW